LERSTPESLRGRDGGEASRLAGWRCPSRDAVGTQGSVGQSSEAGLLPCWRTHRRQRMSRGRRGRERRPHALFEAHAPGARRYTHLAHRQSTRPSLGPLTRARPSPLQLRRGNPPEVARSSRYRGRANLAEARRNRHRGLRERNVCGSPRITASARKVVRDASDKEGRHGVRPREDRESSGSVPARSSSCRNRQATPGPK
jgi:hypothetical protein